MTSLITRNLLPQAEDLLAHFPAVVIQGARQVGKSTLASMVAGSLPHVAVSFDDDDVRESARLDPRAFVRQAGEGPLVIDEVQREPSVLLAIKSAIESLNSRPGTLWAAQGQRFTGECAREVAVRLRT